jgi:hypothetical protein
MKKTLAIFFTSALVLAAIFGVAAFTKANAQNATPTAPESAAPVDKGFIHPGFDRGGKGGTSNEDLANALGITTDELTAAYTQANEAALKQAVEAGLITQAQADELGANGQAFPFGGRWSGWMQQNGIDFEALLADALGISSDELQTAYATAYNTRIDQAVTDGNLTQEQADLMKGRYALSHSESFQTAMQSAYEAAVQQAVSDGVITQAQADLILQRDANGMGFPGMDGGRGFPGMDGGRGHHRGGWEGAPANPSAPAAPSTAPSSGTGG